MRRCLNNFTVVTCCTAMFVVSWPAANQSWANLDGGAGPPRIRAAHFAEDTCRVIKEEAIKRGLPEAFFARLIWKESLFNPSAVSPKGAQGIAQFIPSTASERDLADSFDPATALSASAHFLSDLKGDFGSLGVAAAAYNAGPTRIANWMAGAASLPLETQEYVHAITGHTAEEWVANKDKLKPLPISDKLPFDIACQKLAARELRARSPDAPFRPLVQEVAGTAAAAVGAAGPAERKAASKPVLASIAGSAPRKAAAPKPVRMPWGVQIAANFSKKAALDQFARVKAKFPGVLGKHSPVSVATKARSRGTATMHSIRAGAPSRAAAEELCGKLRSAGGACVVVRN